MKAKLLPVTTPIIPTTQSEDDNECVLASLTMVTDRSLDEWRTEFGQDPRGVTIFGVNYPLLHCGILTTQIVTTDLIMLSTDPDLLEIMPDFDRYPSGSDLYVEAKRWPVRRPFARLLAIVDPNTALHRDEGTIPFHAVVWDRTKSVVFDPSPTNPFGKEAATTGIKSDTYFKVCGLYGLLILSEIGYIAV
jgi:hypothetical protein